MSSSSKNESRRPQKKQPYTIILEIKFHSFQSQELEAIELAFLRIYALVIYIQSKAVANSKNNNSITIKIKGQRVACTGTMKNLIVLVAHPPLFTTHSSEHFILLPTAQSFSHLYHWFKCFRVDGSDSGSPITN